MVTDTAAAGTIITSADGGTISGNTATWNVGELAAGASKNFTVKVVSRTPGNFCDTAAVTTAQGLRDSAQACNVWEGVTGVLLEMVGDPDPIPVGDTSKYTIRVTNQGSTKAIETLKIVATLPNELELVAGSVSDGGVVSGTTATWNVGELAAGASKSFKVNVVSRNPGSFCDTASVASAQGLKDSAQACTLWKGVTGVLLEMVDDPDPIQVGEISKFTVRVTNQGSTMDISDLNIVAILPAELDVVPGTVSDGGVVSGKTITWPAVSRVAPKAFVVRAYTAKAVKAGDARSKVAITTSMRKEPIEKFESTTVY